MAAGMSSEELWRECARWLTRCDVLREDHKANWATANIIDLAYILRDGVLLCNLLNTLDPGCIDNKDVNQKPQMAQFLCLRNIQIFLQTLKDMFDIKECDLFEPMMLFDLANFHRVLCTLSKLSNSAKAQRRNIVGFHVYRHGSKEDIYQSLKSVGGSCTSSPECSWMKFSIRCPRLEERCEEVYEDLCYVTFSPRLSQENIQGHPIEKRDHVIKELLDTEKNYVDVLKTLLNSFMKPLSNYLSNDASSVIFKHIPELNDIHTDFYKHLQGSQLSKVFLTFREKFLVYGTYCSNLTDAQVRLQEECEANEILNQEVIRCQEVANKGKFKLRDVLSVPMQRILKYHLLLEKLIEETLRTHEEYAGLKRARESMLDVATYINEVKRDSDHIGVLRRLQDNISDWTLPPDRPLHLYGRLLKDGELKIRSHHDHKVHLRYVFVFDRIMVLCKSVKGGQFSFKELLQLQEFYVEDVSGRPVLTQKAHWSYQWLLVRKDKTTVYTLYARTVDLKKKMLKALQEAMDSLDPPGAKNTSHLFEMHTFDKPATCNRCSKFLKGLIFQGHRCRVCGIAVHKDCISGSGRCTTGVCPLTAPEEPGLDFLWYAGEMERETADNLLRRREVGTYLVRRRHQEGEARYAISLKTADDEPGVRHMRVFRKRVDDDEQYYLSESRFFKSVPDIIKFYEVNPLKENYERLNENAKLQWPYRQLVAEAVKDFSPDGPGQIPLKVGNQVLVFNKTDTDGWWKGKCQNVVGFFPGPCVRVFNEVADVHE